MALRYPLGFRINPAFEAELKASPEYKAGILEKAEEAANYARAFAPKPGQSRSGRSTGDYVASIRAEPDGDGARLIADDYKAFWIEFGTGLENPRPQGGWSPAFAPLRRGVRAAGLELGDRSPNPNVFDPRGRGSKLRSIKTGRFVRTPSY